MSKTAFVHCLCGEVQGRVEDASPKTVNRIVCYCHDCQAFAHHLGRADLLDARGGTDLVQVAPAALSFDKGAERIAGLRLTPKGLLRWYATCCKTPLGNTAGPGLPFVGIVAQAIEDADAVVGKPMGAILGKYAIGTPPAGSDKMNPRLLLRVVRLVLGWRLRGKTWPHPFFDRATRGPKWPVVTLSPAERDAVRSACGPHPTAVGDSRPS
jgi:hypothetical protein